MHPGGPFWARRDGGAWSIPKGEFGVDEHPLEAAGREFIEELGSAPQTRGAPLPLPPVRQKSGKIVHAFAVEGDFDPAGLRSNTFQMEWPPRSGRMREFPEVDRAEWFSLARARQKIIDGQRALLDALEAALQAGLATMR